jgi:hypothetical protein
MTSPQLVAFGVMFAVIVVIPSCVAVGVPLISRLLFVAKVERIRDDCWDAASRGFISDTAQVERFIRSAEWFADNAKMITLTRMVTFYVALAESGGLEVEADHAKEHEECGQLLTLRRDLDLAVSRLLMTGTVTALVLTIPLNIRYRMARRSAAKRCGNKQRALRVPSVPKLAHAAVNTALNDNHYGVLIGV